MPTRLETRIENRFRVQPNHYLRTEVVERIRPNRSGEFV